jgi:Rod binding domain-containing protein
MDMEILGPLQMPAVNAASDPRALAARAGRDDTVAQGFESMFASLLIKQMRQSLEPDTLFGQDNGDVLGGMFDFFLGQHLARSGALGIGAMVQRQMPQVRASHDQPAVSATPR